MHRSSWVNGQNYVHFAAIAPTNGQIVVTMAPTAGNFYVVLNGFQIAYDTSNLWRGQRLIPGPFTSWINVKTQAPPYAAYGDGVHDDTVAIQNALNNVGTSGYGSVVYLPSGTYLISDGNHGTNSGSPPG